MATLFHYSCFQPLWEQLGICQIGPMAKLPDGLGPLPNKNQLTDVENVKILTTSDDGILIHYTDPFILRGSPLRGLKHWHGPRLLACGDLHHGSNPVGTVSDYLEAESHDAVLLTFNPALVESMRDRLSIPVHSLPPSFFRYPSAIPIRQPRLELLHLGNVGPHHIERRRLLKNLHIRGNIPLCHGTTRNPEEAAQLYAQHALVLNVPLNHDLNHRFFEIMAAGVPQVVFGDPGLVGEHRHLAERPDIFWASTIEELEKLVAGLFADPEYLRTIPVAPPPYWELRDLLKAAFAP